jgi:hypothetical protein
MSKEPPEFDNFDNSDDSEEMDVESIQAEMVDELSGIMDWNQRMQRSAVRSARKLLATADNYDALGRRCRDLATMMIVTAQQLSDQAANLVVAEFDVEVVKVNPDNIEEIEEEDE